MLTAHNTWQLLVHRKLLNLKRCHRRCADESSPMTRYRTIQMTQASAQTGVPMAASTLTEDRMEDAVDVLRCGNGRRHSRAGYFMGRYARKAKRSLSRAGDETFLT
jgi:hypothetical protein